MAAIVEPSVSNMGYISTVLTADKIVLLDGGKQVAVGRHNELAQQSPLYREICISQLGMVPELQDEPQGANNQGKAS